MEAIVGTIVIAYFVGIFVSMPIYLARAKLFGIPGVNWREFVLANPLWFGLVYLKLCGWPLVLGIWLAQGMPARKWQAVTSWQGKETRAIVRREVVAEA